MMVDRRLQEVTFKSVIGQFVQTWQENGWGSVLCFVLLVSLVVLVVFAWGAAPAALLVAGASSASGFILGFLFGIPRTSTRGAQGESNAPTTPGAVLDPAFQVNTNLEQISDWLTKMIVGVGLVELRSAPDKLTSLAAYVAPVFQKVDPQVAAGAVLAVMLHFGIFSFLLGYLWTRLYLTAEFTRAEREVQARPEYFEGLMNALLYVRPPEGFEKAILHGEEYHRRYAPNNDRIWMYLACAYAQKYKYLKRQGESPDQAPIDQARSKALEAVRRALEIAPEERSTLRSLWDPAQATPSQDDLVVFFDDPDFEKLLSAG